MAKPLAKHAVFPPMVVQMMAVGEETGPLDKMLDKIAEFYDQEVEATVDALTSLIEPLLIVVIGGSSGGDHRPVHADVQHHQADQVTDVWHGSEASGRDPGASAVSGPRRGPTRYRVSALAGPTGAPRRDRNLGGTRTSKVRLATWKEAKADAQGTHEARP